MCTTADTAYTTDRHRNNGKEASAGADYHAEEQRAALTTCSCKAAKGTVHDYSTLLSTTTTVHHHYCPPPLQLCGRGRAKAAGAAVLFNAAEAAARITLTREMLRSLPARFGAHAAATSLDAHSTLEMRDLWAKRCHLRHSARLSGQGRARCAGRRT